MLLLSTQKVADDSPKKAVGADLHFLGNIGSSTINKTAGPTLESAMPGTRVTLEESTPIRSSLASGRCWCSRGGTATGVGCELMCQSRRLSTVRPLHVEGVTGVKSPTHNLKMSSALALGAGPARVTSKRELFRARSRLRGDLPRARVRGV